MNKWINITDRKNRETHTSIEIHRPASQDGEDDNNNGDGETEEQQNEIDDSAGGAAWRDAAKSEDAEEHQNASTHHEDVRLGENNIIHDNSRTVICLWNIRSPPPIMKMYD